MLRVTASWKSRLEVSRTNILLKRAEVEPIPVAPCIAVTPDALEPDHNQVMVGFDFDIPIWNQNQGNIRSAGASTPLKPWRCLTARATTSCGKWPTRSARSGCPRGKWLSSMKTKLPDAEQTLKLLQEGLRGGQLDLFRVLQGQRAIAEAAA